MTIRRGERVFQTSTSMRIRTLRRPEHHSGAQMRFPDVDLNEDSHPSMPRTPLWCPNAFSKRRPQRGFAPFDAQNTTLVPKRVFQTSTSTRIRTLRRPEHNSGAQTRFPDVDLNEDSHTSLPRTPLWCPSAFSRRRPQRGFAPLDAQNTTLVSKHVFQTSTSTRIRTLRCPEHHSGAQSRFPDVDLNEDSHPSIPKTPFWCPNAFSRRRPQRRFAPFHAQN